MQEFFYVLFVVVTLSSAIRGDSKAEKCSILSSEVVNGYWAKTNETKSGKRVLNITNILVEKSCKVALCEDVHLMGYCAQIRPNENEYLKRFGKLLQSDSLSATCSCRKLATVNGTTEDDPNFDRNYVGLVYSPYDKYWELLPNGTYSRVPWNHYEEDELRAGMELMSTKFSYLSTYGMGTYSNTSEWYEGDKIGFVPKIAAEINQKLGYPALRVSVGIFRKDDVNIVWKSKELYNAIDAAKLANRIFNGTVWGIVATSLYVSDFSTARDAIDMIKEIRDISDSENLHLKVGIRSHKCSEFIATKRPEDDSSFPYKEATPSSYVPLTSLQKGLQQVANNSDFMLCTFIPKPEYGRYEFFKMMAIMQAQFVQVRDALKRINPSLRLVIETGVPSYGIGNGFENSVLNLRDFWYGMAKFAKKEEILLHMVEAFDQPWKSVQDGSSNRLDINGPNGADGHYGWWKRVNNSVPPLYIEKISENGQLLGERKLGGEHAPDSPKSEAGAGSAVIILMGSFFGFILFTMGFTGYLWLKLRKAKRQIISPVYISQFMTGGDDVDKNDNYAVALRIPYDRKKYEIPKETFQIDKSAVMGSGQCGVVCRGTIKGHMGPVAFKCTSPSSTVLDIKSLMSEIKILSYIGEHPNILCILGAYTKKIERGIVYLALEYCSLGSLESFLRKADTSKLDQLFPSSKTRDSGNSIIQYAQLDNNSDQFEGVLNPGYVTTADFSSKSSGELPRFIQNCELATISVTSAKPSVDLSLFYKWAYQIASAMEYVAAKNVIHADLASRNVLLVGLDQVKVSDFGLSRKLYQEVGTVHDKDTPLPWRWMAPESLKHLVVSVETDVWAFGVTIWEIFSLAEVPYHGVTYNMQFTRELEKGEIRLPQAKYASSEIHEVLMECWDTTSSNRPSFTFLKEFFHDKIP